MWENTPTLCALSHRRGNLEVTDLTLTFKTESQLPMCGPEDIFSLVLCSLPPVCCWAFHSLNTMLVPAWRLEVAHPSVTNYANSLVL